MTRYRPQVTRLPDGTVVEDYGPAHVQRQADASLAVHRLSDPDAAIVLRVGIGGDDLLRVYRTEDPDDELRLVVWIRPSRIITPSLQRVNVAQGRTGDARVTHLGNPTFDPLHAPDDRELEVSTRQCVVRVSRRKLLERVGFGQQSATLDEVRDDD